MSTQDELFNPMECDPMELIEHIGPDADARHKWPQMLVEMFDVLFALARRAGDTEKQAARRARDQVIVLCEYFGGKSPYLPTGESLRIAARDALIYKLAKRGNIQDLADRFKMTSIHVYRICAEQKALHVRKLQGRLFDDGEK